MKSRAFILKLLRWFCKEEFLEEIEGDLVELHGKRAQKNSFLATARLIWDVLRSFRLSIIKKPYLPASISVINYFKTGWRYARQEGIYTVFNVTSLALGILFVALFVWYYHHETTFDQFHSKADRIYRLSFSQYEDLGAYATTPYPIADVLTADYPQIEMVTRFLHAGPQLVQTADQNFRDFQEVQFVNHDFFQIFDFELTVGNPHTALEGPGKVVISKSLAERLFGTEDPVGQELRIGSRDQYNSVITGVFVDPPTNSQLQFDILVSFDTFAKVYTWYSELWQQMPSNYTYVMLREGTDVPSLISELYAIKDKYAGEIEQGDYRLTLMPLEEIHLSSDFQREPDTQGNRQALLIFGTVALVILIIAWINYINLASSRFLKRQKELGIRKVMGASKGDLVSQLMAQSLFVVLVAVVMSFMAVYATLPALKTLINVEIALADLNSRQVWLTVLVIVGLTILLAGLIPSLGVGSGIVRRSLSTSTRSERTLGWKRGLLVIQIATSVVLIAGTLIIREQLQFINGQISTENLAVVPINSKISSSFDVLKTDLEQYPEIEQVSASSSVPGYYGDSWPLRRTPESTSLQTENYVIEEDYPALLGYELVTGRWLRADLASDKTGGYVINETAVAKLGLGAPEEALGETLYWGGDQRKEGVVVGVVRDFHFRSLHQQIEPAVIQFRPEFYEWMGYNFVLVRTNTSDFQTISKNIQASISKFDDNWLADISYYDDNFERFHDKEISQSKLILLFSIVAVLISCLGQLGLMIHTALSRQREVAIRRVMGAALVQNWWVITREYLVLLLVAVVMAGPIGYYLMTRWLSNFAYKISLSIEPFMLASFITVCIMIAILSVVSIRTAMINPAELIREE